MPDMGRLGMDCYALIGLLGASILTGAFAQAGPPEVHYYPPRQRKPAPETARADVCVYGGTSAGVIAAVQLAKLGRTVILIEPGTHLGGLTTGGLSYTDIGNKAAIGGMARDFYRRVGAKYGKAEEWTFEPHVAEQVMKELVEEAHVPVRFGHFLKSIRRDHGRIRSLTTEAGLTVEAREFIDATYEGDLMAKAGVKFTVGRENNGLYHETLNGVQVRKLHQFEHPVDHYVREGDPASGLLPGIEAEPLEPEGTGDHRVQAYTFRLCVTKDAANRIPWPKPKGYDAGEYELTLRYLRAGWDGVFGKFDALRGGKFDKNNHGATSTDYIGQNFAYPNGDYRTRERIFQRHLRYVMGWFWFLANDPRVPESIRTRMGEYGLCRDEFTDTGGWPPQLYVREARRMVSDYVMTEHNCRGTEVAEDAVGLAAYGMDSHNCRRFVRDGRVMNEGDVQVGGFHPYPIAYRSIVPTKKQCENLFVPVCLSTSHIAYGSIRMEPVFMILGQSAALAADLALRHDSAVQDVPYAELRERLLVAGQILEWKPAGLNQQ